MKLVRIHYIFYIYKHILHPVCFPFVAYVCTYLLYIFDNICRNRNSSLWTSYTVRYCIYVAFLISHEYWLILIIISVDVPHRALFGLFEGLKPCRDGNLVWTRFHSQSKISAEIQLLPWNLFNPQPVEQHGEKDKHLQTCKSITKTAPLPHAED